MSRIFKFRVWCERFKMFHDINGIDDWEFFIANSDYPQYDKFPENMEQYTNIDDKNGTPIYEGDILQVAGLGVLFVHLQQGQAGQSRNDNVLQYTLASNIDNPEKGALWNLWSSYEVEVIGNIHQNPELLEQRS